MLHFVKLFSLCHAIVLHLWNKSLTYPIFRHAASVPVCAFFTKCFISTLFSKKRFSPLYLIFRPAPTTAWKSGYQYALQAFTVTPSSLGQACPGITFSRQSHSSQDFESLLRPLYKTCFVNFLLAFFSIPTPHRNAFGPWMYVKEIKK